MAGIYQHYLSALFCLVLVQATNSFAALACRDLLPDRPAIYLGTPTSPMATPESLPTVRAALEKIDSMIQLAQSGEGTLAIVYKEAMPALRAVQKKGQSILESRAADQDTVFDFFLQFSSLIDLPKDYANLVGQHGDGFETLQKFSEEGFQERRREFEQRRRQSTEKLLKEVVQEVEKDSSLSLTSSYKYISVGRDRLPDDLNFSFQYQYIFKVGLRPLPELFVDRENGKVYLGVSFTEDAWHDGQRGQAKSFVEHDLRHAYTQKYYDQLLFAEFKADTLQKQIRLKQQTHQLLQARIREYQKREESEFRMAVEVVLFSLLHEQSLSYPFGVSQSLSKARDLNSYRRSIPAALLQNRFGDEYLGVSRMAIMRALDWVQGRANADTITLRRTYR